MILLLLTCAVWMLPGVDVRQCDTIERNHVRGSFEQWIFWDYAAHNYDEDAPDWVVRGWLIVQSSDRLSCKDKSHELWVRRWDKVYRITAPAYSVTRTCFDREQVNRKRAPDRRWTW